MKQCYDCNLVLDLGFFNNNRTNKDGKQPECKKCQYKRWKNWWARAKQDERYAKKRKELAKQIRVKTHDELVIKKRIYWANNRTKLLDKKAKYYAEHREEIVKKVLTYQKTEVGRIVKSNVAHKRRAAANDTDITKDWLIELKRNSNTCEICSIPMIDGSQEHNAKQLDHIVPLKDGGLHKKDNVRYICRACNSTRHVRVNFDFI